MSAAPEPGIRRFSSPNAAEMWLQEEIGSKAAMHFISSLYNWGPSICSDGWHADVVFGEVKMQPCNCAEELREFRSNFTRAVNLFRKAAR